MQILEESWRWIPPKTAYPFNDAVDFTYIVRNPNKDFGAEVATLTITMRDAGGSIISTDDLPVWPVRPGETIVGGSQSFSDSDQKPASVSFDFTVADGSWVPAAEWEPASFESLTVVGLRLRRVKGAAAPDLVGFPSGYSYFTGEVRNPNTVGFKQFIVDVLHRDSSGRIVALYDAFEEKIPAGGRVAFRIDTPDRLPAGDMYQAFARPWYDAEDRMPILGAQNP